MACPSRSLVISLTILVALSAYLYKYLTQQETRQRRPGWQVKIPQGVLEESPVLTYSTLKHHEIHSFYGIPYGSALRYRRPEAHTGWKGVYVANEQIECIQANVAFPYP